jgi:hypothetical protein
MDAYGKKRGGTSVQPGHTGYPNDAIFVFDSDFEKFCDEEARKLSATRNDPFLLGHFSDNELPFPQKALDKYLALPESDPGSQAAKAWLTEHNIRENAITNEHRQAFLKYVVDRYFKITSSAIKKYDPNHFFLGSRFYGTDLQQQAVLEGAAPYVDIVSINYYDEWTPNREKMANWEKWSGKPFIITEFYTKGEDSGLPNNTGAGWIVHTQQDRGRFYQNFCLGLLGSRVCVGWHWFQYMDNDPNDLSTDPSNRDSNKGIVTIEYKPYQPLLDVMRELNERVYTLIDFFDKGQWGG